MSMALITASLWIDLAVGVHARNTTTEISRRDVNNKIVVQTQETEAYPYAGPLFKARLELRFLESKEGYFYTAINHMSSIKSKRDNYFNGFNGLWIGGSYQLTKW